MLIIVVMIDIISEHLLPLPVILSQLLVFLGVIEPWAESRLHLFLDLLPFGLLKPVVSILFQSYSLKPEEIKCLLNVFDVNRIYEKVVFLVILNLKAVLALFLILSLLFNEPGVNNLHDNLEDESELLNINLVSPFISASALQLIVEHMGLLSTLVVFGVSTLHLLIVVICHEPHVFDKLEHLLLSKHQVFSFVFSFVCFQFQNLISDLIKFFVELVQHHFVRRFVLYQVRLLFVFQGLCRFMLD